MVINEKALVTQMKNAYNSCGYTVAVEGDRMYLTNGFWLAEIDVDNVPDKILGMFGEHIRDVPKDGDAYKVTKDKDGAIVQKRILPEAMGMVMQMYERRNVVFKVAVPVVMQKTNLTYDGCRVWQAERARDIFLIDPRYAAMIDKTKDVYMVGEGIYAEDDDSKLWILWVAKESDKTYLEHMEKISWVKE
ncbi:MAG: hypothetical protein J6Q30_00840 [Oscillospiraceae bacterium]|nr:hypothetical protein [Oscillospiraceae bacterium]